MPNQLDVLKKLPLFNELNDGDLKPLESLTTKCTYTRRQYLFMEGEPREAVYFIERGTVKIFKIDGAEVNR